MPNDFSILPVHAPSLATDLTATDLTGVKAAAAPVPPAGSSADMLRANPSIRLDGALGMVVIEFHDGSGAVTESIPTEQQLRAYQVWQRTGTHGAPPAGLADADVMETGDLHVPVTKRV